MAEKFVDNAEILTGKVVDKAEVLSGKLADKVERGAESVEWFVEDNIGFMFMIGPMIGGFFAFMYFSNYNQQ